MFNTKINQIIPAKLSLMLVYLSYLVLNGCQVEDLPNKAVSQLFWLENEGAQMPVLVEGNTTSKTFIVVVHGGPGGHSRAYNEQNKEFSQPLEERYAMVYWDQRLAGNTRGKYVTETLTVKQMKDDLTQLIQLLYHQYGADISLFLMGHSWGGYLSAALLSDPTYEHNLAGWINVDAPHDLQQLIRETLDFIHETSSKQIALSTDQQDTWLAIQTQLQQLDTSIFNLSLFLEVNGLGGLTEQAAIQDQLIHPAEITEEEIRNAILEDHHPLAAAVHARAEGNRALLSDAFQFPLTPQLHHITLPSLLLWGKYDFVVPPRVGEVAYKKLGTIEKDKELIIFDRSGHSPMDQEGPAFVAAIINFVERYR